MKSLDGCVTFLRELIRTPSLPGQEREVSELVRTRMKELGYDEVWRDEAGNVIGLCRGQGSAPCVMLNSHLDHVDTGEPEAWPYPPFGAEIHDGKVWGRGAVDIKGPLAAQVYGVARLISEDVQPPGDVYVSAVVQEETGGLGACHLLSHLRPALVIVGEPSRNQLRRGHRGRSEMVLRVRGRSVHASIPAAGVNPLEVVANFILGLRTLEVGRDKYLGSPTVAPTLIRTDQTSANVTPGEAWLTCDCRTVPGVDLCVLLRDLKDRCLIAGAGATVEVPVTQQVSYTGLLRSIRADHPSFLLSEDDPALLAAFTVLAKAIGLNEKPGVWSFATDGGHFAQAGATVIGYGPGSEERAHTTGESIEISEIEKALAGYQALAKAWPAKVAGLYR